MNNLSGKVLQRENQAGLKDLIVLAYDIDYLQTQNGDLSTIDTAELALPPFLLDQLHADSDHPELRLASQLIYRLFTSGDNSEDPVWAFSSPPGGRIGSSLTAADGSFSIHYEDAEFQHNDQEQRPDVLLMVLAPDQALDLTLDIDNASTFIGTPEYMRILHLGFFPIRNLGREESVVMRISQEMLEKFELGHQPGIGSNSGQVISSFESTDRNELEFQQLLRDRVRTKVDQSSRLASNSTAFTQNLSALPKSSRRSPYFFKRSETNSDRLRNFQQRAGREGIDRMSLQTLVPSARTVQAYRSIDGDWLSRIMPSGNPQEVLETISSGSSVQLEIDYAAYCHSVYAKNGGAELSRRNATRRQREDRDEVLSRLQALKNPPVPTDPDAPDDTGNDSGPESPEGNAEDRIKAIVLQRVQALRNAGNDDSDQNNETAAQQKQRISVSLEELTPPIGPADATAYHDFTSLQIAYPDIWSEAFDGDIEEIARQLKITYDDAYETYREGDGDILDRLTDFDEDEIYDLREYTELLGQLTGDIVAVEQTPMPQSVRNLIGQLEENPEHAVGNQQASGIDQLGAGGSFEALLSSGLLNTAITTPGIQVIDSNTQHWNALSIAQQAELIELAEEYASLPRPTPSVQPVDKFGTKAYIQDQFANKNPDAEKLTALTQLIKQVDDSQAQSIGELAARRIELRAQARAILASPEGRSTKAQRLMAELAERLKAPHSFRIFAENSYNFGILTTHRQKWVPGEYQAGDLVSTITLAPGEKRQYAKKEILKKSRNRKEAENNASTLSDERAYSSKVTGDIIDKLSTNTNFAQSISASASGQLGVFSINGESSSEFGRDQAAESERRKQSIREATRKAAQEYRNERSLEVSTESSIDVDSSRTSEISNPNNEITVTYLFYELERQYRVSENPNKVTPVILVAQHVPAPHEIDEDFLLTHEWILRRVMLDRSFHTALDYIADGLVSDEIALQVSRENYETQKALVEDLGEAVASLNDLQQTLRDSLIQTAEQEKLARVARKRARKSRRRGIVRRIFNPDRISERIAQGAATLTLGESDNPAQLEARREALETRLEFLDTNLESERDKLNSANSALNEAGQELTAALKESFTRRNLVTQLKLHVKQNILYYMQAIWTHEYSHQRQLRLYNLPVDIPTPGRRASGGANPTASITINPIPDHIRTGIYQSAFSDAAAAALAGVTLEWPTGRGNRAVYHNVSKRLQEIADVDNLLGFKGNYMIFPLKTCTFITDYMMQDYVDEYLGVRSPDPLSDFSIDELLEYAEQIWHDEETSDTQRNALEQIIVERLNSPRTRDERIVVPTGQLFIEALKGTHALLEHFKLKHRELDVQKVQEEVRAEQLENLRRAMRLLREEGALLGDPEADKSVVVSGTNDVDVEA